MQFRNSRSLASAPALAAIALTRTDHTRHFRRGQLRLPAMRLGDLLRSLARYLPSSSCPGLMKGRRGGGLSHMLPAWLPPPERGRVGVGVDSTMWSAAVSLATGAVRPPPGSLRLPTSPFQGEVKNRWPQMRYLSGGGSVLLRQGSKPRTTKAITGKERVDDRSAAGGPGRS